jgi:hypothetical protein
MRITGSRLDQEITGPVDHVGLDTPPTEELPAELTQIAPTGLSRARRRYRALAAAVRSHERRSSHPAVPKRPADHALYAALGELEATVPAAGEGIG